MKVKRLLLSILLVLLLSSVVGAEGWSPRNFVDDMGSEVRLENRPERIISLAPSITEVLFALGVGDRVVGVSAYSDFPEEAKNKPIVGDAWQLNIEQLVSLDPDLIIADGNLAGKNLESIISLGLKVFVIAPKTYDEVAESLKTIGELADAVERGNEIAADMLRVRDEVREKVAELNEPKVFFEVWPEPLMTAGPGSFVDELIDLAGGSNVAFDAASAWPTFNLEVVVERDPDVVILTSIAAEEIKSNPLWQDIAAVKKDRVVKIVPDTLVRTTSRLSEGLIMLAELLHPEIEW